MRPHSACLAPRLVAWVGLSLAALTAACPAVAGDLDNGGAGGIKDYGSGAIPAPAPIAYDETYKWYLRGDVGTAFKNQGTIDTQGLPTSVTQPGDWHELSIISFGFGRYITPSLRLEYTLDYRPERVISQNSQTVTANVTGNAQQISVSVTSPTGTVTSYPGVQSQTNVYNGVLNDNITEQNTTLLMSGFYDLNRGGSFHPYIGAGAGIGIHQVHRTGTDTYNCTGSLTSTVPLAGGFPASYNVATPCLSGNYSGLQQSFVSTSNANAIGYGLAAQLSAGVTYDLSQRIHWDTGYRVLWQSGRISVASSDGLSTLRINDIVSHEVRTGVRWDLW